MPRKKITAAEPDSAYFLKILMYFILGTIWVQYQTRTVFPLGLLLGLLFAQHDHFRIDRRIEYVVLLIAAFLAFELGHGVIFFNLV